MSTELLSWITDARSHHDVIAERIALSQVTRWKVLHDRITHDDGAFFDIIAVDVTTEGREVRNWTQPLLSPRGVGVAAFLVRRTADGPQVLASTRVEGGSADVLELGPTVQCTPENYAVLPGAPRCRSWITCCGPRRTGPSSTRCSPRRAAVSTTPATVTCSSRHRRTWSPTHPRPPLGRGE
ncbi:hypothetical protein SHKM778_32060 [Streptomyces sp. KM77-8]|uniref:dTDP-4-dehydro-6-deoxy-alpha-D-glucopyranose 2,3-dehydratase domain-containing protein n=1 Tax=Streptomyces haneummycinicus TaxID=3074435 RepID=A0AAT9HHN3_9ACTN